MPNPHEKAIVRIFDANGRILGSGFLATDKHILTCTHVAGKALSGTGLTKYPPSGSISLDFPFLEAKATARIVRWEPIQQNGGGDITLLEIETSVPEGASCAALQISEDLRGRTFSVLGFPKGREGSVHAGGEFSESVPNGLIQIEDTKVTGYQIEEGFSGAPVRDIVTGQVAGIIALADRNVHAKVAFMIPSSILAAYLTTEVERTVPPIFGGTFDHNSPFYIERNCDVRAVESIRHHGVTLTFSGPHLTGKNVLLNRVLEEAHKLNKKSAFITLEEFPSSAFEDGEKFFRCFATCMADALGMQPSLEDYWVPSLAVPGIAHVI